MNINIKETILIIKKISKRKTKFPTHYNTIIILHINDTDFREKSQVSSCREMHHILPWHATVKHTCTRGCAIVSKKTPDFLDSTRQVLVSWLWEISVSLSVGTFLEFFILWYDVHFYTHAKIKKNLHKQVKFFLFE